MASPQRPLRQLVFLMWPAFSVLAGVSLALNVMLLAIPIYTLQVYDRVLSSEHGDTLAFLTLMTVVALGIYGILEAVRRRILSRLSTWVALRLGSETLVCSLGSALSGTKIGTRPLRDLTQLRSFLTGPALIALCDAPWVPLFGFVLFLLHPAIGLFALAAGVLLTTLTIASEMMTRRQTTEAAELQTHVMQQEAAMVRNVSVVHALGMEADLVSRWQQDNGAVVMRQERASDRAEALLSASRALRMVAQVGILALGAGLVMAAELSAGGMIAASIILGRALSPLEQAIGAWRQWVTVKGSLSRLDAVLSSRPGAVPDIDLPDPRGELRVRRLTYLRPGEEDVMLSGVSFQLKPGEAMGVIGPSGVGKSTLINLLLGICRPARGSVRLDGMDIADWPRRDLGRHVGYLPQAVELFEGSVAENIARMAQPESERVVAAAKEADVHELILSLPDGYETQMGSGEHILSGGQLQRIGLARAMYGEPILVVLDEPSSNLDATGEEALQRAIVNAKARGTTLVMVSHRPSSLGHMDLLLVLQSGGVRHFGPIEEVMRKLHRPGGSAPRRNAGGRKMERVEAQNS